MKKMPHGQSPRVPAVGCSDWFGRSLVATSTDLVHLRFGFLAFPFKP